MDRNTEGQYGFRKDALGVKQGQQQMNYNAATEDLNAKKIRDQQKQAQYQAKVYSTPKAVKFQRAKIATLQAAM